MIKVCVGALRRGTSPSADALVVVRFAIMFRKPKRSNIRQRRHDQDSDDENDVQVIGEKVTSTQIGDSAPVHSAPVQQQVSSLTPPPASSRAPMTSKLSFAEEHEDGDTFQIKKSGQSRRIAKQLEKERRKREEEMAAKEREVKRLENLNTSLSIRKQMEKKELDVVFVNQHAVKKTEQDEEKESLVEAIDIPEEDGMSDADDDGDGESGLKVTFRPAASRTAIPDADMIFSLKKQRQSRRNQDEFICLVQDSHPAGDPDVSVNRDDDDDDEFEDDRIEFEIDKTQSDRRKAHEAITLANEEKKGSNLVRTTGASDSDSSASSDNELSRWEEAQIMKGVGAGSAIKVQSVIECHNSDLMDVSSPQSVNQLSLFDKRTNCNSIPAHLSRSKPTVTPDHVLSRLHEAVVEKKDKLAYLERQLNSMSVEEKSLTQELERLEKLQEEYDSQRLQLVHKLQHELTDRETAS